MLLPVLFLEVVTLQVFLVLRSAEIERVFLLHNIRILMITFGPTGYDDVTMEDLKSFRQWGSKTPGHPENFETRGVEVTTGPLGMGISNAVGLACAEAHLAATYNKPGHTLIDHYTYTIAGDGCFQEGISHEACSYAGHLKLGKLIAFYDDNNITIDGETSLSFTEDVGKRYEAYGWQVICLPILSLFFSFLFFFQGYQSLGGQYRL